MDVDELQRRVAVQNQEIAELQRHVQALNTTTMAMNKWIIEATGIINDLVERNLND